MNERCEREMEGKQLVSSNFPLLSRRPKDGWKGTHVVRSREQSHHTRESTVKRQRRRKSGLESVIGLGRVELRSAKEEGKKTHVVFVFRYIRYPES